jgi:hypothetical protein
MEHDLAAPEWAEIRVLQQPWFPAELEIQRVDALVWAPAAFRKHGVYLSARDLEARMSETDSVLLGRVELERAFTALGERLAAGASWPTSSSWAAPRWPWRTTPPRVTGDVDAMFKPHRIVHEEALRVAGDLGLPRWRLNEQASSYISGRDDADKRRVFDHPGLRVMAASPRHIFAMRARGQDA